jgi:hypothetical protein
MMSTSLNIHRLLDEAFAGVDVTPEAQDLKEEIRGNLVARVAELEASGAAPEEAARLAMAELGDVAAIVDETRAAADDAPAWRRNRVRPRPGYVVRTVVIALVGAAALATLALLVAGLWTGARPVLDHVVVTVVAALAGAAIVGDALRQETTTNYPVTRSRAIGYAAATALGVAGLGIGAGYVSSQDLSWLVVGGVLAVASIVAFTYLAATQTNRHKPWVVHLRASHEQAGDRFEKDPAAAARFGLYTVTIWIVAAAAFVVLGITVGWAWSWLALLGGLVALMLTLARMLFGERASRSGE